MNLNNHYVTNLQIAIPRRSFLALLGVTGLITASCARTSVPYISSQDVAIKTVIAEKTQLILAATSLAVNNPAIAFPLKVVSDHNLMHISALTEFLPSADPEANASSSSGIAIDLPALSNKCLQFSNRHLELACSNVDAELSRTLGLIAGSEIMHHALLNSLTL